MKHSTKVLTLMLAAILISLALFGCAPAAPGAKLDPNNPTAITVWHYYNGAVMNAFDQLVKEFNESVGLKQGIIVQGSSLGNVNDLQTAVLASARKDVGSEEMPNIFASYADTAYAIEQLDVLVDLGQYFTQAELAEYIAAYIDEGKIGNNNELKIFPIAKSTEILMINETDWQPFAEECGHTYADLATPEGLAAVAKAYYEWVDAKTPDISNDGRAFYGRDAIANMLIIGAKQLGAEIIKVDKGVATITVDKTAMRRIWDTYYLPYVSGYFLSAGRYRSDDTKVGEIISYVGSTSSAMYFPAEVTIAGETYPVNPAILPAPVFEGATNVVVQQGAGMVVTKSTPQKELASATFLKWFTGTDVNSKFSALSGYLPVKKEANDYDKFMSILATNGIEQDEVSKMTLKVAFDSVKSSELYTSKAFDQGLEARKILDSYLQNKAETDRLAVVEALAGGATLEEAIAVYATDANFESWYAGFSDTLLKFAPKK
jgi:ABC-type sugar transport system, periplasmic component